MPLGRCLELRLLGQPLLDLSKKQRRIKSWLCERGPSQSGTHLIRALYLCTQRLRPIPHTSQWPRARALSIRCSCIVRRKERLMNVSTTPTDHSGGSIPSTSCRSRSTAAEFSSSMACWENPEPRTKYTLSKLENSFCRPCKNNPKTGIKQQADAHHFGRAVVCSLIESADYYVCGI